MRISSLIVGLFAVGLCGCTAVNAQLHLEKADASLAKARERGADSGALYEWTLAERYLEKAREAARQNQFGTAERLADFAATYADHAIIALESQGRDLAIDESSLNALPDRIGSELRDEVQVQIDYVDLPPDEIPTSADDIITDEEVERLFGRQGLDAMNGTPSPSTEPAAPPTTSPPTDPEPADPDSGVWQDLTTGEDDL